MCGGLLVVFSGSIRGSCGDTMEHADATYENIMHHSRDEAGKRQGPKPRSREERTGIPRRRQSPESGQGFGLAAVAAGGGLKKTGIAAALCQQACRADSQQACRASMNRDGGSSRSRLTDT